VVGGRPLRGAHDGRGDLVIVEFFGAPTIVCWYAHVWMAIALVAFLVVSPSRSRGGCGSLRLRSCSLLAGGTSTLRMTFASVDDRASCERTLLFTLITRVFDFALFTRVPRFARSFFSCFGSRLTRSLSFCLALTSRLPPAPPTRLRVAIPTRHAGSAYDLLSLLPVVGSRARPVMPAFLSRQLGSPSGSRQMRSCIVASGLSGRASLVLLPAVRGTNSARGQLLRLRLARTR
jgi:hypothetical protein